MKKINLYLILAISLFTVASCMVDDDVDTVSEGPYIVGFKNSLPSYIFTDADSGPITINEPIDLVGGNNGTVSEKDITIQFQIDPSSTAIAGTHYSLPNSGNTLTLKAGENFVNFPVIVNTDNLPGNLPQTIVVNLLEVSSSNGVIVNNRKSATITIAKCESNLAGNYSLVVTRLDNNTSVSNPNEVLTELSLGTYVTSSTGNYGSAPGFTSLLAQGAPRNGFVFNDVCQSVVIEEQNLGNYFSNLVYGNETDGSHGFVTLDPVTGDVESITMYYIITFTSPTPSLRPYKAVYTKL